MGTGNGGGGVSRVCGEEEPSQEDRGGQGAKARDRQEEKALGTQARRKQWLANGKPISQQPPLKELQALQLDLGPVNNQATKAHERLKQNLSKRQKTLLDSRSSNIQGIPGFWAQTFVNHPQLSAMISDQDEDMLSYMINLEVQELRHPKRSCKITFYFRNNPYFQNAVVVKEFLVDITGYRLCHSTPIQWRQDYKIEADSHRNHNKSPNFFNWFTDHNFAGSNRITEIIRKDLWLNPLYYYKMMKAPEEGEENESPMTPHAYQDFL
ncbi:testis-specific Y-encoded protein 9-like [Perognathus longimembris pacificus]|uniref:testis-specific Y-encoded protein 9-like n=1 Tax=Perognathus longimembris pacificus TaxID=214514 RepID=UPI002019E14E|nr:testis-specific Y-encoded protein 9-like [Perognathus longimembris pacificus]